MKASKPHLRIDLLRRAQHVTRRALASKAGITEAALYRIERGSTDPKASTLWRLAKALRVTVGELFKERKRS
jgi:transcriptional regulator with XRE-family HTH domain